MEDLIYENMGMLGSVLRVEKSSIFNGDGLRTAVFMKGCPLRCWRCSTPESHHKEIRTTLDRKITCGCIMTVEEVLVEVRRDIPFYFYSGDGMTTSGGEILTRLEFVCHLLHRANQEGINTCIETSLYGGWGKTELILSSTDTAFADIKVVDPKAYKRYVGVDNEVILSSTRRAGARKGGTKLTIRSPLILGVNDSETDLKPLGGFLAKLPGVDHLQLLSYHRFGIDTYRKLGLTYQLPGARTPSQEYMGRCARIIGKYVKAITQCPPGVLPVPGFGGVHSKRKVETIVLRYGLTTVGNTVRAMHGGRKLYVDYNPSEVEVFNTNENVRKDYASRSHKTPDNMTELVNNSEMIVLGVMSKVVGSITDKPKVCYRSGQLMLTMVTGVEQPQYTEHLGKGCKVVIHMPNVSSQVGEGVFVVSRSTSCTGEDVERVTVILRSCDLVEEIPDGVMAEILPSNGSTPGFFHHTSNLMVKEAEKYGLDPDTAIRLFAQTMKGSVEMILSSNISLQEPETALRLPGGATITVSEKIEPMGSNAIYDEFVRVSVERCKEFGKQQ